MLMRCITVHCRILEAYLGTAVRSRLVARELVLSLACQQAWSLQVPKQHQNAFIFVSSMVTGWLSGPPGVA